MPTTSEGHSFASRLSSNLQGGKHTVGASKQSSINIDEKREESTQRDTTLQGVYHLVVGAWALSTALHLRPTSVMENTRQ